MAGAGKKRQDAIREAKRTANSNNKDKDQKSSSGSESTDTTIPSIPQHDGNNDPSAPRSKPSHMVDHRDIEGLGLRATSIGLGVSLPQSPLTSTHTDPSCRLKVLAASSASSHARSARISRSRLTSSTSSSFLRRTSISTTSRSASLTPISSSPTRTVLPPAHSARTVAS